MSINIKPDSLTSKYLKDSLNFTESDYKDVHVDMCDGILNTILLINSDGSIIDVNTNNVSDNQRKLITYLLSNLIYEHPDSLSRSYLLALKRYY